MPKSVVPAKPPTDEAGAVVGALVALLGVGNLATRLGLTGDDVALVLGSLLTIAGVVRAWWLRTHPPQEHTAVRQILQAGVDALNAQAEPKAGESNEALPK